MALLRWTASREQDSAGAGNVAGGEGTAERCLALVIEGVSVNTPCIDEEGHQKFRSKVGGLAMALATVSTDQDRLATVLGIVREFESYRAVSENAIRDRERSWRALSARLLRELFASMQVDASSKAAAPLATKTGAMHTTEDMGRFQEALDAFLRPREEQADRVPALSKEPDRSVGNMNAAGLRGGGAALVELRQMWEDGEFAVRGVYVVLFRLGCLEMIQERFGLEVAEDCMMQVAAHLTQLLRSDDAMFYWSASSLLAIVRGRTSRQILAAELQRVGSRVCDIPAQVGQRTVMLRIPVQFAFAPLGEMNNQEDLMRFTREQQAEW